MPKEQHIDDNFTIIICMVINIFDCLDTVYSCEHNCHVFKTPLRVYTSLHGIYMLMVFTFKKYVRLWYLFAYGFYKSDAHIGIISL